MIKIFNLLILSLFFICSKNKAPIEGLYVLKTCESSRFKIKIVRKDNAFEYSILDRKKSISKGLVKIEKENNKTYLTFGKISALYDDEDNIQIQNYGNSMNEYNHFIQCEEKYLSFQKIKDK